jgi:hypothetical protein
LVTSGTAAFTIPSDATTGAHRIALLDAQGVLIGWFPIQVTAPAALGATGATLGVSIALAVLGLVLGAGALGVAARRREA